MKYYKSYVHICNKKLDQVIEFIDNNKSNHDIKTMCTVIDIAKSTYYNSFDKTKSSRTIENEELKSAIIRIYKGIYGAPRIHHILGAEDFNVSIKRVQIRMTNDLVIKALKNAYYSQNPDKNKQLIFHTDLGSQYASNDLK